MGKQHTCHHKLLKVDVIQQSIQNGRKTMLCEQGSQHDDGLAESINA